MVHTTTTTPMISLKPSADVQESINHHHQKKKKKNKNKKNKNKKNKKNKKERKKERMNEWFS